MSPQNKPSIVFCHGLWADGSCFNKVMGPLRADGFEVIVTDVFSHIEIADGRIWLLPDGIDCFAGDLTDEEKELTWATAMAPVAELFTQKVEGVSWRTKPSWYIVANNDRTVDPDLERFVANRMRATTSHADSSHVPMLSHPELVLDVIRDAADAVQESAAAVV